MAISAIDKEFLTYFARLDELQKKSLLELIRTFLKTRESSLSSVTLEQYNQELDEAMKRVSKGEFTSLEELEKEMGSW